MTLNELLEKKRREFDDTRALLNEFAAIAFEQGGPPLRRPS